MKAVVQRVLHAQVTIDDECTGSIGQGLMVLVGFTDGDDAKDLVYMADKILNLRIFSDAEGKMNLSVSDIAGEVLIVPNFTLYGDCRRGRRPSFTQAAGPEVSTGLFEDFVEIIAGRGVQYAQGRFGAHMHVTLLNDGPVTLMIDSRASF